MAENQVYLIKSGQNSFVEETEAIIGISGGRLGVGTTTPEADLHVTGSVKVGGDLAVDGTFTTINSSTISVDDKNIELGSTDSPTDTTADGGGITVKGTTDKTFNWLDATDAWTSSEHLHLAAGKGFAADKLSAINAGQGLILSDTNGSGILVKGGKVGIHQATPVYDLDVDGSGNFTSLYVDGNAVLTGEGSIFGKWEDGAAEGEIFYTGGNVGVGTDDPGHDFHVVGDSVVDGNFAVNGTSGNLNVSNFNVSGDSIVLNYLGQGLTNSRGGLIVRDSSDANKSLEYVEGSDFWLSSESVKIADGKELQTDKVRAIDAGGLSLQDDGGNGIFIEDGGQVGVNTSSPNYSLDVNGSTHVGGDFSVGSEFKISAGGAIGGTAPASDGDIIKWDDANNKWVAGANLGGGGGGGVGEVPLATIDSLPSGQSIYEIEFAETYNVEPRIATQLEIDGEGSIIPYVVSGVSTSGYHLIFAQDIPNNNYRIHTTFGGRDVHWETGASASLYYNDGDVSIQRNFTVGGNLTVNGTTTTVNTETVEIEDHNLVIAANTGYNQLDSQYPAGGAYAGILWGTGDAGGASPVSLTYQTNKGFAFKGGNVGIGTTSPSASLDIVNTSTTTASSYGLSVQGGGNSSGAGYSLRALDHAGNVDFLVRGDGNVGIGTTSPDFKLEVGDNRQIQFVDTGDSGQIRIHYEGYENENVRIHANGKTWFNGGNVGIGTTDPGAKLHIKASSLGQEGLIVENSLGIQTTHIGHLSDGTAYFKLADAAGQNHTLLRDNGNSYLNALDGNVGIGTTNPSGSLHVNTVSLSIGSVTVTDDGGDPPVVSTQITGTDLNTKISNGDRIKINNEIFTVSAVAETTLTLSDTPSTVGTFTAYTDNNGLIVTGAGNVGIGTKNPDALLDVEGSLDQLNSATIKNTSITGYGLLTVGGGNGASRYIADFRNKDNASCLKIDGGGNVGIGTTSPDQSLTVGEKVSGDPTVRTSLASFNAGDNAFLEIENTTTKKPAGIILTNVTTKKWTIAKEGDDHHLFIKDADDSVIATFEQGGHVGIGTADPISILHVNESVNTTNTGLTISNYDNTAGTNQAIRLDFGLARNSGALKPYAGRILVGKEDDWEVLDTKINSFMSFNVFEENAISEKMRITSSGNVGIGTTSPSELLEVHSESATAAIEISAGKESTTTGEAKLVLRSLHADSGTVYSRSEIASLGVAGGDSDLIFRTTTQSSGPEEHMRIDSEGNVGIGTTNPTAPLDIESDVSGFDVDGHLVIQNSPGTEDGDCQGIGFSCHDNTGDGNIKNWFGTVHADTYGRSDFIFLASNDVNNNPVNQTHEVLRITSNGFVGIRTTDPSTALEVQGTSQGVALFKSQSTAENATTTIAIESPGATSNGRTRIGADVDDLFFNTSNGASDPNSSVERMRIDTDGNVGIGTTNPGAKLHVTDLSVSIGDVTVTDDGGDPPVVSTQITGTDLNTKISNGDRIKINDEIFTVSAVAETTLTLSGTPSTAGTYTAYTDSNGLIVTNAGNVGIGTTTPGYPLTVHQAITGNIISDFVHETDIAPNGIRIRFPAKSPNNKSQYFFRCQALANEKMVVWSNGDIDTALGNSIGTLSDIRTKDSVVDATPKLSDVMKLRVVNFTRKNDPDKTKLIGFVAQEVEEVFPRFVASGDNREYDEDGNVVSGFEDVKSVKFDSGFAILTKAIQEQQQIIEDLKSQNASLESRISALES